MTPRQFEILKEIKSLLKEAYDHYFKLSDGYCKSSEGAITIGYPNYFTDNPDNEASYIEIYSYVLGPSRNHDFSNFETALEEVRKWHKIEMETKYNDEDDWCLPIKKLITDN